MTEDLRAENERLTAANDRLSRHIISMGDNLETQRRELLAIGWEAGVVWSFNYLPATAMDENPYRKPVEPFGGDD